MDWLDYLGVIGLAVFVGMALMGLIWRSCARADEKKWTLAEIGINQHALGAGQDETLELLRQQGREIMENLDGLRAEIVRLTTIATDAKAGQDRAETLLVNQAAKIETNTKAIADLVAQLAAANVAGDQAGVDALASQVKAANDTLAASTATLVAEENVVDAPAAPAPVQAQAEETTIDTTPAIEPVQAAPSEPTTAPTEG